MDHGMVVHGGRFAFGNSGVDVMSPKIGRNLKNKKGRLNIRRDSKHQSSSMAEMIVNQLKVIEIAGVKSFV
jgi:hypothetical protein